MGFEPTEPFITALRFSKPAQSASLPRLQNSAQLEERRHILPLSPVMLPLRGLSLGGRCGIRTHGPAFDGSLAFQASAIGHSTNLPCTWRSTQVACDDLQDLQPDLAGTFWCPKWDSNPHALRHRPLKPTRLPISPFGQSGGAGRNRTYTVLRTRALQAPPRP